MASEGIDSGEHHAGAQSVYASELQATAGASGIQVVRDDPEASVLRLELDPGKVEWVTFNPSEANLEIAGQQTKRPYEYIMSAK